VLHVNSPSILLGMDSAADYRSVPEDVHAISNYRARDGVYGSHFPKQGQEWTSRGAHCGEKSWQAFAERSLEAFAEHASIT